MCLKLVSCSFWFISDGMTVRKCRKNKKGSQWILKMDIHHMETRYQLKTMYIWYTYRIISLNIIWNCLGQNRKTLCEYGIRPCFRSDLYRHIRLRVDRVTNTKHFACCDNKRGTHLCSSYFLTTKGRPLGFCLQQLSDHNIYMIFSLISHNVALFSVSCD